MKDKNNKRNEFITLLLKLKYFCSNNLNNNWINWGNCFIIILCFSLYFSWFLENNLIKLVKAFKDVSNDILSFDCNFPSLYLLVSSLLSDIGYFSSIFRDDKTSSSPIIIYLILLLSSFDNIFLQWFMYSSFDWKWYVFLCPSCQKPHANGAGCSVPGTIPWLGEGKGRGSHHSQM